MHFTIGQASKAAEVAARAVRLYEARGLIAAPERTESGYRLFTDEDVNTLTFIRSARTLGLPLDAISEVMELAKSGPPCERTCALLDERVAEIDAAIADLQGLRRSITAAQLAATREPRSGTRCAVIEMATANRFRPEPETRTGCAGRTWM